MARRILNYYNYLLLAHPYKTTAFTTGILCASGDVIAQQFVEKTNKHNYLRTVKFFMMGSCFIGPGLRVWYGFLERYVTGTAKTLALKKMLCDQLIWAPTFLAAFFCLSDALSRKSVEEMRLNLKQNYPEAIKTNYYIWPAVQMANFYFVPLTHRVIVVNVVALFWNTYLTYIVNKQTVQK